MSYLKMALRVLESAGERGNREVQGPGISSHMSNHALIEEPQSSSPERVLTCFECGHFYPAVNSPNPTQAWGHCEKRNKGRYGVATACEAIMTSSDSPGEAI